MKAATDFSGAIVRAQMSKEILKVEGGSGTDTARSNRGTHRQV